MDTTPLFDTDGKIVQAPTVSVPNRNNTYEQWLAVQIELRMAYRRIAELEAENRQLKKECRR